MGFLTTVTVDATPSANADGHGRLDGTVFVFSILAYVSKFVLFAEFFPIYYVTNSEFT